MVDSLRELFQMSRDLRGGPQVVEACPYSCASTSMVWHCPEARQWSVVSLSLDCVVCLLSELPEGIIAGGTTEGSVPGFQSEAG